MDIGRCGHSGVLLSLCQRPSRTLCPGIHLAHSRAPAPPPAIMGQDCCSCLEKNFIHDGLDFPPTLNKFEDLSQLGKCLDAGQTLQPPPPPPLDVNSRHHTVSTGFPGATVLVILSKVHGLLHLLP